jgi:hypothetical protein
MKQVTRCPQAQPPTQHQQQQVPQLAEAVPGCELQLAQQQPQQAQQQDAPVSIPWGLGKVMQVRWLCRLAPAAAAHAARHACVPSQPASSLCLQLQLAVSHPHPPPHHPSPLPAAPGR